MLHKFVWLWKRPKLLRNVRYGKAGRGKKKKSGRISEEKCRSKQRNEAEGMES